MDLPETPPNGHAKSKTLVSDAHRSIGQKTRRSIRKTLQQALELKDLMFDTALELKDSFVSAEAADLSRARAQALTGIVKSWSEAVNVARIERGKPLPGSLKPVAKQKQSKAKTGPAFTEEA